MPKPVKVGLGRAVARASALRPVSKLAIVAGVVFGVFLLMRKS